MGCLPAGSELVGQELPGLRQQLAADMLAQDHPRHPGDLLRHRLLDKALGGQAGAGTAGAPWVYAPILIPWV